MTTQTLTLTDFLLARVAEDEAVARTAAGDGQTGCWEDWSGASGGGGEYVTAADGYTFGISPGISGDAGWHIARAHTPHIARHDPARVLAECEAKRRIVGQVKMWQDWSETDPARRTALNTLYPVAMMLALPYADHPDYRDEWRA